MDDHRQPARDGKPDSGATNQPAPPAPGARFSLERGNQSLEMPSRQAADDPWYAMHHFASEVAKAGHAKPNLTPALVLQDRDGDLTARLEPDERGQTSLRFESAAGRHLYQQVQLERKLARGSADNRLMAMSPQPQRDTQHAQADVADRPSPSRPLTREEQRQLKDSREQAATRWEASRDTAPTYTQQLNRAVIDRASFEQLERVLRAQDEKTFEQELRRIQAEIERAATAPGPTPQRAQQAERTPGYMPVHERFTADGNAWRTDYWFRDRPDRLGFAQTWLTLSTAEHSPAVVMGMVDRARELGWNTLHLSGTPEFKREAWIAAAARAMQTSGYVATHGDRLAARGEADRLSDRSRENEGRSTQPQRQTPDHQPALGPQDRAPNETARDKQLHALITKALRDAKVPQELHAAVRKALLQESHKRLQAGATWRPRVFDINAPRRQASQGAVPVKPRQVQRDR